MANVAYSYGKRGLFILYTSLRSCCLLLLRPFLLPASLFLILVDQWLGDRLLRQEEWDGRGETERQRGGVKGQREREREREKESVFERVRESVCVCERESVCVFVSERDRERERERDRESSLYTLYYTDGHGFTTHNDSTLQHTI